MWPKHSATPVTHEKSQIACPPKVQIQIIMNRKGCFCTWCWTSGDIFDIFSFFTVMLLTSRLDLAASLASGVEHRDIPQCILSPSLRGYFNVILLHRLGAILYLWLLSFDPAAVPSVRQHNILLICWCTHAAFLGIHLWSCTAPPTRSEGRRRRWSALRIHQAGE